MVCPMRVILATVSALLAGSLFLFALSNPEPASGDGKQQGGRVSAVSVRRAWSCGARALASRAAPLTPPSVATTRAGSPTALDMADCGHVYGPVSGAGVSTTVPRTQQFVKSRRAGLPPKRRQVFNNFRPLCVLKLLFMFDLDCNHAVSVRYKAKAMPYMYVHTSIQHARKKLKSGGVIFIRGPACDSSLGAQGVMYTDRIVLQASVSGEKARDGRRCGPGAPARRPAQEECWKGERSAVSRVEGLNGHYVRAEEAAFFSSTVVTPSTSCGICRFFGKEGLGSEHTGLATLLMTGHWGRGHPSR